MFTSALFICKQRTTISCGTYSDGGFSSGLYNSALHVSNMLNKVGIPSTVRHVIDNNDINKVVTQVNPTHVFIEALWVVPEKFEILSKLHPHVKWIIRVHSETPFLSGEGIAMQWILQYVKQHNVQVAFNSLSTYNEFVSIVDHRYQHRVIYLPNHYTGAVSTKEVDTNPDVLDISCFGAIRPLKNQLIQATAAIRFAQLLNRPLRFHINSTRIEGKGDNVLKNLRSLFEEIPHAVLVEHSWLPHDEFVDLIASMDMNMQVSLSETFNIVTADAVVNNTPVVVSDEISWVGSMFRAKATSASSIVFRMILAYVLGGFGLHVFNKRGLHRHNRHAQKIWMKYLQSC